MGEWSTPRPGCFTAENNPGTVVQEAGWALGRSERVSRKDKSTARAGLRTLDRPVRNESLHQLRYRCLPNSRKSIPEVVFLKRTCSDFFGNESITNGRTTVNHIHVCIVHTHAHYIYMGVYICSDFTSRSLGYLQPQLSAHDSAFTPETEIVILD